MFIKAQFEIPGIDYSNFEKDSVPRPAYEDPTTLLMGALVLVAVVGLYLYNQNNKKG